MDNGGIRPEDDKWFRIDKKGKLEDRVKELKEKNARLKELNQEMVVTFKLILKSEKGMERVKYQDFLIDKRLVEVMEEIVAKAGG